MAPTSKFGKTILNLKLFSKLLNFLHETELPTSPSHRPTQFKYFFANPKFFGSQGYLVEREVILNSAKMPLFLVTDN